MMNRPISMCQSVSRDAEEVDGVHADFALRDLFRGSDRRSSVIV
jgi:hypothetical protein